MARAARAAGRPARQLRLRRRGAASRRTEAATHAGGRRHGASRGARGMARVQRNLHSRGRGPDARAARAECRAARPALGRRHCRRARRAAAAARGMAGERGRPWQYDCAEARAARGRGRSGRDPLLSVCAGQDRALRAAARGARRRRVCVELAGRGHARRSAGSHRGRRDRGWRFRHCAGGNDRRRCSPAASPRARSPRPWPHPRSISRRRR